MMTALLTNALFHIDGMFSSALNLRPIPLFGLLIVFIVLVVVAVFYRKSRESYRQASEILQTISDKADEGYYRTDSSGRIVWLSPSAARILGYTSPEEALGRRVEDFYVCPQKRQELFEALKENGRVADYEAELRRADGSTVTVSATSSYYHAKNGSVAGVEGVFRDITHLKKTWRALQESEVKYKALVESTGEAIFTLDREGTFLFLNSVAAERMGGKPEDLVGRAVRELFPEQVARTNMAPVLRVFETGEEETEQTSMELLGQRKHFRTGFAPLRDQSGEISSVLCVARDITDLIENQRRLKDERDFVRSLLETANSLVVCLDGRARITVFNKECERMTGYRREEVIGKSWPDIFLPPEARHDGLKDFAEWVKTHPRDTYEGPVRTKSGEIRTILWSNTALLNRGSEDVTAIAVGQDITERKAIENALKQSERRFLEALSESRDIMYRQNLETLTYDYISDAVYEIAGYSPEDVISMGLSGMRELTHPEDLKRLKDHREQLLSTPSGEKTSYVTEYRLKCRDGRYRWLSDSHALIRDSDGKPRFIIGNVRNITEQKLAEEALRESEERYSTLVENAPVGILAASVDARRFLYANPALCKITGYTSEEIKEMAVGDLTPERFRKDSIRAFEKSDVSNRELYLDAMPVLCKDGTQIYADICSIASELGGERVRIGIFRDVTELKKKEQILRKQRNMLRGLSHHLIRLQENSRKEVTRDLHDTVAQSLCVAKMKLESAMHGMDDSYEEVLIPVLDAILDATTELRNILSELRPSILDEKGLLPAMEWYLKQKCREINPNLTAMGGDLALDADKETNLFRIFQEIMANALKHSGADRVDVIVESRPDKVILTISDNGKGFDPPGENGGEGYGLRDIKERVQLMNGELELDTAAAKGTTFKISIPKE
jgi:PAS domain S-box-containing protein